MAARRFTVFLAAVVVPLAALGQLVPKMPTGPVGAYFSRKQYVPRPLPTFAASRDQLPNPIIEDRPELAAPIRL